MTSIDDLFRKPNLPPKRKFEDPSSFTPQHSHRPNKIARVDNETLAGQTVNGSRSATVQAEKVEDDDDDDIEAGPALPPEDEEAIDVEDEEGRFFGGGVSKQERDVLDYIDKNEDEDGEEKIDLSWLKKTAINLERMINKNAELRAKYEDDPLKFVASEADLDSEIKTLSTLSEHPELYKDLAKLGSVSSLVSLLAHDNTDIAIAVCELLEELTDDDSGAEDEQWKVLVNAMMSADVVDLLVSNLSRLDDSNEADRAGIYHILSVVENLLSDSQAVDTFGRNENFLQWLQKRIDSPDSDVLGKVGQNRQYAAEILAILLQANEQNRSRFAAVDGVDVLLQLLSTYRRRDPEKDSDEQEFAENLFDCLTSAVENKDAAHKFLDGEGIELCLIMLKEGKLSKPRALKVLDHATAGQSGEIVSERLVDAAGLKVIFSVFIKSKKQDREDVEHLIGMFASLLRYLPARSSARIRTLAKFVEKDYEKAARVVRLRQEYADRVQVVEKQIEQEKSGLTTEDIADLEAEWLSRRFDAGLFCLQTIDVILSWLVAEDVGARRKISELLNPENGGLQLLQTSLLEQIRGLDSEQGKETKEILETLADCLV